jgi:hypothetical protein
MSEPILTDRGYRVFWLTILGIVAYQHVYLFHSVSSDGQARGIGHVAGAMVFSLLIVSTRYLPFVSKPTTFPLFGAIYGAFLLLFLNEIVEIFELLGIFNINKWTFGALVVMTVWMIVRFTNLRKGSDHGLLYSMGAVYGRMSRMFVKPIESHDKKRPTIKKAVTRKHPTTVDDRLEKIKGLLDRGLITDNEAAQKRRDILEEV